MEVKIKKSVLFNLLKGRLNENRTNDNPSGNFIHPFDREEAPISPSAHMATQLTVEEPPVGDPDFIPASIRELRSAAARISQEVPPEQVEFFYRSLHKLLDNTLDRENPGMMSEGIINLMSESMDFYQRKIDQLAKAYKEDPYFDIDEAVDDIMNNADTYGLDPALVDPMEIQNDIMQKEKIQKKPLVKLQQRPHLQEALLCQHTQVCQHRTEVKLYMQNQVMLKKMKS